jgi:hypothetical protein
MSHLDRVERLAWNWSLAYDAGQQGEHVDTRAA